MNDLKRKVESVLFAAAKRLSIEEISKAVSENNLEEVKKAIEELGKELEEKQSSIMLVEEGGSYRFTVKEQYLPHVKKVVTQTEMLKGVLETLAVVAYKAPVLQSMVIKVRTNKAYRHLDELEEFGYITREKKGRTKLIKLTQKFFDYFDIPHELLKEKMKSIGEVEKMIVAKEKELEAAQKGVEVVEEPEVFEEESPKEKLEEAGIEVVEEKKGELEVFETVPKPPEGAEIAEGLEVYERQQKGKHKKAEKTPEQSPTEQKSAEQPKPTYKSKGLFSEGVPEIVQEKIEKRVKEIVEGEEEEETSEEPEEENA